MHRHSTTGPKTSTQQRWAAKYRRQAHLISQVVQHPRVLHIVALDDRGPPHDGAAADGREPCVGERGAQLHIPHHKAPQQRGRRRVVPRAALLLRLDRKAHPVSDGSCVGSSKCVPQSHAAAGGLMTVKHDMV